MKIQVIRPGELDPQMMRRWLDLQSCNLALGSPFFSPAYVQAVGESRDDTWVAVMEDGEGIAGFFPFQRRWGAGRPVGDWLSDHHGVIAAPHAQWDWTELLRASRLGFWQFDHLPASQRPPAGVASGCSPALDLSAGFEAWRDRRIAAGGRRVAELPRKARKLAREVGPLRFEADCRDPRVFATVLQWKSEQCRRTGARDCLGPAWTRELLERIAAADQPQLAGRLSALYAGDELVAAHFGMRSRTVWHWWFPVYSHAHASYSPGALLLTEVAQAAAREGSQLLDLGKGDESYKSSFADAALPLLEGTVGRESVATHLRALRRGVGRWLRQSPVAQPLRPMLRRIGRLQALVIGSQLWWELPELARLV
ncbi:MAG TPA: GNAT family N-acetyltransferase [Ramlibacter sp.]|jgi:CelD/BcsL family acetyltransferase involved in cellulose biosynthesis|uniref:GNAT family N-acetyltransferase n=1 Tax=Ramlibacter sp. TaxID=1917967 RepID=UPI002D5D00EF|nr:GNAT family N-acetyltransferase [Ramlibacter sp.]HZY19127.1 GNAT family N-acetyltransferase [Ramlibacter sp.]